MKLHRPARRSHIGLHIDSSYFHAVQGVHDRAAPGSFHVLSAARIRRSGPEFSADQAQRLFSTLRRQGFTGRDVVTAVPQASLLTGVLDLPPRSSGAPLDQIARNELARAHRCEPDQIESAWWEIPQGFAAGREAEGTQVIAVACRHTDAETLVNTLDFAGARTIALDTVGAALARAARPSLRLDAAEPPLSAVLDITHEAALALILRGDDIVYERHIREGGLTALLATLAERLSLDAEAAEVILSRVGLGPVPDELQELATDPAALDDARQVITDHIDSLAEEVRASGSYAGRRYAASLAAALVTGTGANIPRWLDRLSRRLETPATAIDPASLYRWPAGNTGDPGFMTATGLAMHPGIAQEAPL